MLETAVKETVHRDPVDLLEDVGALLWGNYKLASGRWSKYYFDSKKLTLHPEGARLVASQLVEKLRREGIKYIGGTAYGAIPIVSSIALYSEMTEGPSIQAFYHRKEAKEHGTEADAEGQIPPKGTRVAILEDVVTTGDSLLKAISLAEGLGLQVTDAIVLVDRNERGRESIEDAGYKFWSLFTMNFDGDETVNVLFNGW